MRHCIFFFTIILELLSWSHKSFAIDKFPLSPMIADPWVQKFGDWYYMVGTPCPGDWEMQWVGLWKSRDLVNWSGPTLLFKGDLRDRPMWASELYHKGDSYYVITTCNTWEPGNTFMVQSAPKPDGPYSLYTHLPKAGLDPNIFVDTDGKSYLLDSEWIATIDDDWKRLTNPYIGHRANKEGPFMVKSDNKYLRFFARIDNTYYMEMESLEGDSPYSADYIENGAVLTGDFLPGHGCITASPDGSELWYASHATSGGWDTRALSIDKMKFKSGLPEPTVRITDAKPSPSTSYKGNIALGKVANSSKYITGSEPHFATDGNKNTKWRANWNPNDTVMPYLEIDLFGEFSIDNVKAYNGKGKDADCKVEISNDRINWSDFKDTSSARYVRLYDFPDPKNAEISEVEIFRTPYHIPIRTGLTASLDTNKAMTFQVPESGLYDIEYEVESSDLDSSWKLYDNGSLIRTEAVASTGPEGTTTTIISFDVPFTADRLHNLEIVPVSGNFKINKVSVYSLSH